MIRCRNWRDPRNKYLCALCRSHAPRPSPFLFRSYSDSPRTPADITDGKRGLLSQNGSVWSSKNVPRPIPGRGGWSKGGIGASSAIQGRGSIPPTGNNGQASIAPAPAAATDGLLPHERAAKQRLAQAAKQTAGAADQRTILGSHRQGQLGNRPFFDRKSGPQSGHLPQSLGGSNRRASSRGLDKEFSVERERTHPAGYIKPHTHARPKHQHNATGEKTAVWGSLKKRQDSQSTGDFWEKFKNHVNSSGDASQNQAKTPGTEAVNTSPARYWTPPIEDAAAEAAEESKLRARRQEASEDDPDTFDRSTNRRVKVSKTFQDKRGRRSSARSSRYDEEDEDFDEDTVRRAEERRLRKAEKKAQRQLDAMEADDQGPPKIFLPEFINLFNLAGGLKLRPEALQRALEEMGFENITEDSIFTGETASLIALEYGFDPTVDTGGQRDLRPRPVLESSQDVPPRPPVVTIMGHVDHGKTTLLDFLRKSSVVAQEHGGITQHIGAFVVEMSSGKRITFLDTPGHAAFLSMRQRGANVTDIVVLVVAADDSVKPQTLEAIKHAREAKVPMIVAINKIDKEDARPDQVKADLARHGVEIEDFGGDVQVVLVSGKSGQGMEDLEENISLLSEILDVRAERDGLAEGWVLEASVKQVGKSATVLVRRGTLRLGDCIVAGTAWARIRLLRNEAGVELDEAPPGTPVEIIGWRDELPAAGDEVLQAPDEDRARTAVEYRHEMRYRQLSSQQLLDQEHRERERLAAETAAEDPEAPETQTNGTTVVNFSVKCDVAGSVEAICASIQELGNNEVRPRILRSSAGQVSEFDIDHAATSKSIIVNFNTAIPPHIKRMADDQGVRIMDHTVIYHLTDNVKEALSDKLDDIITHKVTGEAEVLQVFPINVKGRVYRNIAGCRVRNGVVARNARVRIIRKGQKIFDGKIEAIKHGKKDVPEMRKGTECGISFDGFEDMEAGDQLQLYEEVREKRTL